MYGAENDELKSSRLRRHLEKSFTTSYGRHQDLIEKYGKVKGNGKRFIPSIIFILHTAGFWSFLLFRMDLSLGFVN